jgi:hypothetical protein
MNLYGVFYYTSEGLGDPSSGASIAAMTLIEGLRKRGFEVGPVSGRWDREAVYEDAEHFVSRRCEPGRRRAIIGYGAGDRIGGLFAAAKTNGITTILHLHNMSYRKLENAQNIVYILVPSRFSGDYYRETLNLDCVILPNLVDPKRCRSDRQSRKYVTLVNPAFTKGVYFAARIMERLGRLRPDISFLVVESRGTEQTLAGCGLDLSQYRNVSLMNNTPNPLDFWEVTKICLMPSLWMESEGMVASEAMTNGLPVVASDRGALPETLSGAGLVLSIPGKYTAATRDLPTSEEVAPWCDAIVRLWDDEGFYDSRSSASLSAAKRWDYDDVLTKYDMFFRDLLPRSMPPLTRPRRRDGYIALVPHLNGIEHETEQGLLELERQGVRVIRRGGSSQIDIARNRLASLAIGEKYKQLIFIDSDIGFDPTDAIRLLVRPEPVIAGIYAKKNHRELSSCFADDIAEVAFGSLASGFYPLKYAATGFLKISVDVLCKMISQLSLPLCDAQWNDSHWPFFQPSVIQSGQGHHYLGEDWAFSHRLAQVGVTPLADTSIRLWHFGKHGFGWEDAGAERQRFTGYKLKF